MDIVDKRMLQLQASKATNLQKFLADFQTG
jgi:hypothetical protein